MKTKDLNFIEAYEAFKQGKKVFLQGVGKPVEWNSFHDNCSTEFVAYQKFCLEQKPLKIEFECEWRRKDLHIVPLGDNVYDSLKKVIDLKKTRVTVEEIVE